MRAPTLQLRGAVALALGCILTVDHVHAANSVNVALQTSFDAAPFLVELL